MQQAEPIAPLLVRLAREFGKLAGLEAALAGAEIKKKATALVIGIVLLVVAALLGIAILATLTATLILAFALIVAPWLAALIVTGIYALVALILALIAKSQLSRALPPVPTKTITSIKENLAWASRLIK